ncbi:MAG: nucleotidyltransferase domain-containing protein, partial [Acidobacteria bacterium]|nr:nucleotidyltransferase domain-containing protein [Acidobacteriota bacterium]
MRAVEECYRGRHVRVFRLDRDRVMARLRAQAARVIAERPETVEVVLFGSFARGDAMPGSDADLVLVVEEHPRPFHERPLDYARFFEGIGVGCDILVYTRAERQALEGTPSLLRTALAEGVSLARRRTDRGDARQGEGDRGK